MSGLSTYYDLICSNCPFHSRNNQSCSPNTNSKLALATKLLGLQKTQVEKLFLLLGFAFYVHPKFNPTKSVPYSLNLQSQLFGRLFDNISDEIVEKFAPKVHKEAFDTFVGQVQTGKIVAQVGLDGSYNQQGTNSQGCASALIAVFEDSYKVIGSNVTKRAQELKPGTSVKGNVVWNTPAQHLEGLNCDKIIENFVKPLANLFDIELSMDQDLKSVNKIKMASEKCTFTIHIKRDTAHILKNIRKKLIKILKDLLYFGDATGKIGNWNFYRLVKCVRATVGRLCKLRKLQNISKDEIKRQLVILKQHCVGWHRDCRALACQKEPILKSYGDKFDKKSLSKLITEVFENFILSDNYVQSIFDCGCTSQNEFLHSILVNRRLVVKSENIHISSYNYDLAFAIGTLFFNLGERSTFERSFSHFGHKLNPITLSKFDKIDHLAIRRREYNLKNKPINSANRATKQAQYNTQTKSRTEYVYETLHEKHEREKKEKNQAQNITTRKKRPRKISNSPTKSPRKLPKTPPPENITIRRSKRQK